MRRTRFDEWPCPIARVTDLVGDWWTPLVLRELFSGRSRFDDIQAALGCSRAVLAQRLGRLVEAGLLVKVPYERHPPRYDYRFTDKGRAFWDVLAAMWRWGSDWMWDDGEPPVMLVDRQTRAEIRPTVVDAATGERIDVRRLRVAKNRRASSVPRRALAGTASPAGRALPGDGQEPASSAHKPRSATGSITRSR